LSAGFHAHLVSLAMDIARTAAWLFILAIILVPCERLFAQRPQAVFRRQFAADIGYYFINSIVTVALLAVLMAPVAVAIYSVLPARVLAVGAHLSLWQRMLATLVVGEFGFYWGHRWSHQWPILWRFHVIHHSAEQVDWLTGTRAHPVDIVVTRLCGLTLIHGLGLAHAETGATSIAVLLLMAFTIFWGFFIHANVRWRLGWLESVIATPAFHRWHHTNDENRDHNYASTLPFYDRLFGTLHLPRTGVPPCFGADTPVPATLIGQLVAPFDRSR